MLICLSPDFVWFCFKYITPLNSLWTRIWEIIYFCCHFRGCKKTDIMGRRRETSMAATTLKAHTNWPNGVLHQNSPFSLVCEPSLSSFLPNNFEPCCTPRMFTFAFSSITRRYLNIWTIVSCLSNLSFLGVSSLFHSKLHLHFGMQFLCFQYYVVNSLCFNNVHQNDD